MTSHTHTTGSRSGSMPEGESAFHHPHNPPMSTGLRPMTEVLERIFCKIGTGWHIAAIPTSICVAEFGRSGSVQRRHDHCSQNRS